ncbi:hypothetical protein NONI108955_44440 [Nocardia ninae]|uniref:Uncharacterized protein n=1 Tax=Nocardia ninae NBRC 108245 TaxID=1210091 RepID=A0A511MJT1_9NOCA|nr:hypothetical protein [Nocardia ninae]GEM40873.1 hypothetical protein NN4_53920 [Nocardia ninae NBRC 108245]
MKTIELRWHSEHDHAAIVNVVDDFDLKNYDDRALVDAVLELGQYTAIANEESDFKAEIVEFRPDAELLKMEDEHMKTVVIEYVETRGCIVKVAVPFDWRIEDYEETIDDDVACLDESDVKVDSVDRGGFVVLQTAGFDPTLPVLYGDDSVCGR